MKSPGAHILFESMQASFERSPTTGTVQVISKEPFLSFFVRVDEFAMAYADGTIASPTSTITMRDNVIYDLVAKAALYDSRVVEFSSRLSFSGNRALADFLLNLVKRPSPTVIRQIALARQMATEFPSYEIERLNTPDVKAVQAAMADFRPILISGILHEWRVSRWNPKALESHFGRYQLVSYLPWAIRDYTMERAPRYTLGVGVPGVLQKYFRPPPVLQKAATLGFPLLWMGSSQSQTKAVTGLHCDCVHGFLCQIFGTKKVFLYPPDQDAFVYPYRAFNMYRTCWTGPDAIDYDRYPLFRHARSIEVILSPGDVLLIPLGWFHCVFALDSVMSISYPVDQD